MLLTRGRLDRSCAAVKVRPHFCHNRSYPFSHEPISRHGLLREPTGGERFAHRHSPQPFPSRHFTDRSTPCRHEKKTPSRWAAHLPRPRLPASLSPFRYPMFRAIWLATLMSNLGVWIQSVGAAWLMTSITDSAPMVALVPVRDRFARAAVLAVRRSAGRSLGQTAGLHDGSDHRPVRRHADRGARRCRRRNAVAAAGAGLPAGQRFGATPARISGDRRRSGPAIGAADGGGAQQHRLQHRPVGRTRHRRAGRGRLRGTGVVHPQRRLQRLHHRRPADVAPQTPGGRAAARASAPGHGRAACVMSAGRRPS